MAATAEVAGEKAGQIRKRLVGLGTDKSQALSATRRRLTHKPPMGPRMSILSKPSPSFHRSSGTAIPISFSTASIAVSSA
jgi:hypothetical protein